MKSNLKLYISSSLNFKIRSLIHFLNFIIFILVLVVNPIASIAQHYNLTVYNTASGMPGNQVNELLQDRSGMLWVATMNGVAVFNGSQFTKFERSNPIATNPVKAVFQDSKGRIWIGMLRKGICRINGSKFKYFNKEDGIISEDINAIAEDKKGNIWFGTPKGLIRYDSKRFSNYTTFRGLPSDYINDIETDALGRLWIATNQGVSVFDGSKFINYTCSNGLSNEVCLSIKTFTNGKLMVGTLSGASLFKNGKFEPLEVSGIKIDQRIDDISGSSENDFCLASISSGHIIVENGKTKLISVSDGLPTNNIKAVMRDREGNHWIGTWNGLCKWSNDQFWGYTHEDGLANNNILSIACDSTGRMYFGTLTDGLSIEENGKITTIGTSEGLKGLTIWSIFIDSRGLIWLGTGNGPAIYNPAKSLVRHPFEMMENSIVYSMCEDTAGSILLGTDNGIYTIDRDENINKFSTSSSFKNINILSLFRDQSGKIWVGTNSGLALLENGNLTMMNQKLKIPTSQVTKITNDTFGNLILSTEGNGIFVVTKTSANTFKTVNYKSRNGLSSDLCRFVFTDGHQNLWIGNEDGLDLVKWDRATPPSNLNSFQFTRSNGYKGVETNGACTDLKGNLWFATVNGAIRYIPGQPIKPAVLPILRITNLKLLMKSVNWNKKHIKIDPITGLPENLNLTYKNNHVTINFNGVYLTDPEEVRYQHILEGFDEEWSPVSTTPFAVYSNLDPGSYTFKVKCSADGRTWTAPIVYSFSIEPPYWKTPLFYFLYVLVSGGIIMLLLKVRTRNLERKQALLKKLVDERTDELSRQNLKLEKLSIVASETHNSVLIFNSNREIEWTNKAFNEITGYTMQELIRLRGSKVSSFTFSNEADGILEDCIKNQKSSTFESQILCKDGSLKWVSNTLTPILQSDGKLYKFVVIDSDLTFQKSMEQKIMDSLKEKDLLLREIHHRVKNNLQIIISLFNLQSHYVVDPTALQALKEGQDRIKSIALIHERFYQNQGLTKIDFDDYIKRLIENLFMSFRIPKEKVSLEIDAERITLDIDTAVPCALIINELVSNSLKHAFINMEHGALKITLKHHGIDKVRLIVKDNGIGLPEGFDISTCDSLGMQLINALSSQLDADMKLEPGPGTSFVLDFKIPKE